MTSALLSTIIALLLGIFAAFGRGKAKGKAEEKQQRQVDDLKTEKEIRDAVEDSRRDTPDWHDRLVRHRDDGK